MNPEFIRRPEDELETELPALIEILNDHVDNEGAFITEELEQTPAILDYAMRLDQVLTPVPTDDSWQVVYRSIHFAAMVNDLLDCGRVFDFSTVAGVKYEDLREYIFEASQVYMGQHPYVDGLTGAFMPELDPTGEYSDIAEVVVALALSQLERGAEAVAAAKMIDEWDGTVE